MHLGSAGLLWAINGGKLVEQNLRGIDAVLAVTLSDAHTVAHQSARDRIFTKLVDRRQPLPRRESDDPIAARIEVRSGCDQQRPRAASSICCSWSAAGGKSGLMSTPIRATPGTRSRNNPSRFGSIRLVNRVTPVTFPPGRLKLSTKPALTGSPPIPNTIGIVVVAAFAASPEGSPPAATMTATCRPTRSAASAGKRL